MPCHSVLMGDTILLDLNLLFRSVDGRLDAMMLRNTPLQFLLAEAANRPFTCLQDEDGLDESQPRRNHKELPLNES